MMRSAKKTYEIDMLHGAILPKLLRFAVPLTLSTMLQLLFNAVDVPLHDDCRLRDFLALLELPELLPNLLIYLHKLLIEIRFFR